MCYFFQVSFADSLQNKYYRILWCVLRCLHNLANVNASLKSIGISPKQGLTELDNNKSLNIFWHFVYNSSANKSDKHTKSSKVPIHTDSKNRYIINPVGCVLLPHVGLLSYPLDWVVLNYIKMSKLVHVSDFPGFRFVVRQCMLISLFYLRWKIMSQGIPEEVLRNKTLITHLADVAKDAALLHGVLLRTQETPNSSEVRREHQQIFSWLVQTDILDV